jgi:hypothetical protein
MLLREVGMFSAPPHAYKCSAGEGADEKTEEASDDPGLRPGDTSGPTVMMGGKVIL